MVPTGGTDLVSTYGLHVSNFRGGGVNLDPHFQTLHPNLDIFHFRGGGGGKLGPTFSDSPSKSGHFSFSGGGGVNLDPHFRTLHPNLDIFHFRGGGGGKLGPSDLDSLTIFISRGGGG